jgi:hypothetical protein
LTVDQYMIMFLKFFASVIPTIEYDFSSSIWVIFLFVFFGETAINRQNIYVDWILLVRLIKLHKSGHAGL